MPAPTDSVPTTAASVPALAVYVQAAAVSVQAAATASVPAPTDSVPTTGASVWSHVILMERFVRCYQGVSNPCPRAKRRLKSGLAAFDVICVGLH